MLATAEDHVSAFILTV